jgi:tRNA nucleotidyltransferase (CCA-adding enzyme)
MDIERQLLRAVSLDSFGEDSLVLRAAQFASRFEFGIDPDTVALCQSIDLSDLPFERIWGEIKNYCCSLFDHPLDWSGYER